jgi:hypothetical protein
MQAHGNLGYQLRICLLVHQHSSSLLGHQTAVSISASTCSRGRLYCQGLACLVMNQQVTVHSQPLLRKHAVLCVLGKAFHSSSGRGM